MRKTDKSNTLCEPDKIVGYAAIEFLAQMIRFKSYSDTPGEAELSRILCGTGRYAPNQSEASVLKDINKVSYLAGLEGVVCGPGGKYNTMPDERVEITDFIDMVKIYMLVIERVRGLDKIACPSFA